MRGLTNPNPNKLEVRWVGEKGRGLFTRELIRARSFICEYKVAKSCLPYPRRQRPAIEREYQQSGEGCYILEAQDKEGRWWCFDATRRLNQFGRYINHAPGSMANATPAPPVLVEGRLRVTVQRRGSEVECGRWSAVENRAYCSSATPECLNENRPPTTKTL